MTASELGLTDVLCLLLECLGNDTLAHKLGGMMIYGAAWNLQESTIQFLLRWGVKVDVGLIRDVLSESAKWICPTDGSEEACLRTVTALLDAGVNIVGEVFDECRVKSPSIIELLRSRGARIW